MSARTSIVIYHERYRTLRERLYVSPESTQNIREDMVPLSPGEPGEPRPTAAGALTERTS
jgi:hypothetical protein